MANNDEWWNSLTAAQQAAYLAKHPKSKKAKGGGLSKEGVALPKVDGSFHSSDSFLRNLQAKLFLKPSARKELPRHAAHNTVGLSDIELSHDAVGDCEIGRDELLAIANSTASRNEASSCAAHPNLSKEDVISLIESQGDVSLCAGALRRFDCDAELISYLFSRPEVQENNPAAYRVREFMAKHARTSEAILVDLYGGGRNGSISEFAINNSNFNKQTREIALKLSIFKQKIPTGKKG
jgi:hypothetical protein